MNDNRGVEQSDAFQQVLGMEQHRVLIDRKPKAHSQPSLVAASSTRSEASGVELDATRQKWLGDQREVAVTDILPRDCCDSKAVNLDASPVDAAGGGDVWRGSLVYVIDANEETRRSSAVFLESCGCRVVAEGGVENWEALQCLETAGAARFVLITAQFSDMDVLEWIRGIPEDLRARVPVVMLTTKPSVRYTVEAMRAGAFHVLVMPGGEAELRVVAERALRSSRRAIVL